MLGHLELSSSWASSDAFVRATLSQAVAASEEGKQATSQAMAARDEALKDASTAKGHYNMLEGELQGLRDELAKEIRDHQVKEEEMKSREAAVKQRDAELSADRDRLKTLEQALKMERVELDAEAKVLAKDRAAFARYEERLA